jgi:hypothetical protein
MKTYNVLRISSVPPLLLAAVSVAVAQGGDLLRNARQPAAAEAPALAGRAASSLLRARAAELAAATADAAPAWGDRRAAVGVLSAAADLMWGDAPDRAREWLRQAWALAGELPDKAGDGAAARFRSSSPRRLARALVLAVAQRCDGVLADDFLARLGAEKEESAAERGAKRAAFDDKSARSEQLLNLALSVVNTDPDAAARLAELSLADGVSFRLQSVLLALRERDKGAADRLFDSAMRRIAERPDDLSDAQVIASYLFTPGRVVGVGADSNTVMAVGARHSALGFTPAEADPERARRFLNIVQRGLLSAPAPSLTAVPGVRAREIANLAGSLEEGFRLYAPDMWTQVAQRVTAVLPDLAPRDAPLPQPVMERLAFGASAAAGEGDLGRLYVEGLKEAAEKETDPVARKYAYVRASLATAPDDLSRGLSLAAAIGEEGLRNRVSAFLTYRASLAALEKGQLDKATALAAGLEPLQRALVCIAVARRLAAPTAGEDQAQSAARRARAADLLSDAEKALGEGASSDKALHVRLGLVAALAQLDAQHALALLDGVVADINRADVFDPDDAGAPAVGGLYGLPVQSPQPAALGGFGLKDAFGPLSKVDFEGSVYVANKLKAAALRGVCLLEIARGVLAAEQSAKR